LPTEHSERAVYVVDGAVEIAGQPIAARTMAVLSPVADVIRAGEDARLVVLTGEPVGPRHIWWNFVSSRKQRIEQAKQDWRRRRFPAVPGDEDERTELPES
jgi:redox-sensitive bicupin YhaK (pirin superfamily)